LPKKKDLFLLNRIVMRNPW